MHPCKAAVGAGEVVELRLLADPENAESEEAHHVHDQWRSERDQRVQEVAFGVDRFRGGDAEVEDEQRHGHAEDAVAESGQALEALAGDLVVGDSGHRGKNNRGQPRGEGRR